MISQELEEIKLLIHYAAPEEERLNALSLLTKYSSDRIALNIFRSFYSYLPEGLDDSITKLLLIDRKEGVFLICVITGIDNYLYIANQEKAEFLGQRDEGIWDEEVLKFFDFQDRESSIKKMKSLSQFSTYCPAHTDENVCPVCSVTNGEFHTLGCPVEICPWCKGQLTNCNCRFTMAGKEKLAKEADLAALEIQLHEKGRIPFDSKEQRPSYPSEQE